MWKSAFVLSKTTTDQVKVENVHFKIQRRGGKKADSDEETAKVRFLYDSAEFIKLEPDKCDSSLRCSYLI